MRSGGPTIDLHHLILTSIHFSPRASILSRGEREREKQTPRQRRRRVHGEGFPRNGRRGVGEESGDRYFHRVFLPRLIFFEKLLLNSPRLRFFPLLLLKVRSLCYQEISNRKSVIRFVPGFISSDFFNHPGGRPFSSIYSPNQPFLFLPETEGRSTGIPFDVLPSSAYPFTSNFRFQPQVISKPSKFLDL